MIFRVIFIYFRGSHTHHSSPLLVSLPLRLEDLHDDLLLFDEEGADDLLADSLVAQHAWKKGREER